MAICYILYSQSCDSFYIGYTKDPIEERIRKHNNAFFKKAFTARAKDWQLFIIIECTSLQQAKRIEKHIKKMKSRKYIHDLEKYPEMRQNLRKRFEEIS